MIDRHLKMQTNMASLSGHRFRPAAIAAAISLLFITVTAKKAPNPDAKVDIAIVGGGAGGSHAISKIIDEGLSYVVIEKQENLVRFFE
jgi:ribulose 1,5-bisphosphate synthetase/thiazole synthase